MLPQNFNVNAYRLLNEDIAKLSNAELVKHFIETGCNEPHRKYEFDVPNDFCPFIYKFINTDLNNLSIDELYAHFMITGQREHIRYNLNDVNVFIYCCGKSGSSTLHKTFLHNGFNVLCMHTNKYFKSVVKTNVNIQRIIENNMNIHSKIFIVDSYRNPIERKISSFFQNIDIKCPNHKSMLIDELISFFNDDFLYTEENYQSIDELFDYFNIPYFEKNEYDVSYFKTNYKNITFIKLKFLNIGKWNDILSDIFQMPVTLKSQNDSSNKEYYERYVDFLKNYKLPTTYYDDFLLHDNTLKIFNSDEQYECYLAKWKNLTYDYPSPIPPNFNCEEYVKHNCCNDEKLLNMNEFDIKIHYLEHRVKQCDENYFK